MARSAAIAAGAIAARPLAGAIGGSVTVSDDEIVAMADTGGVNTPGRFAALEVGSLTGEDVLDLDILYLDSEMTLVDTGTITVTLTDSDTGTLGEFVVAQQPIKSTESAAFSDVSIVLTKTGSSPSDADAGILGEGPVIAATPTTSDSATLTESSGTQIVAVADTDTGSLAEYEMIPTTRPPQSDSFLLVETADITSSSGNVEQSSVFDTDTGTLADTSLLAINDPVPDTDSATLAETPALAVQRSDTGTLAETASIAVTLVGSDAGVFAETSTQPGAPVQADSGTLADTGSLAATPTTSDSGTAADTALVAAAPVTADTGSLGEAASIAASDTDKDAGVFAEAVAALLAALSDKEADTLADTPLVTVPPAFSDTAAMTELSAITVTVVASETWTFAELVNSIPATLAATDSATEAESTAALGRGTTGVALGSVSMTAPPATVSLLPSATATVSLLE